MNVFLQIAGELLGEGNSVNPPANIEDLRDASIKEGMAVLSSILA